MRDKRGRLSEINASNPPSIELGCGPRKRNPQAIGIDAIDYPEVDVVGDATEVLSAIPTASIASIHSEHFIEHVTGLENLLTEAARVLVTGGTFAATAPHFSNPWFYSDPTHVQHFGLYTFSYMAGSSPFRRKVPNYGGPTHFDIERVRLGFKSSPPFYGRHLFKRCVGRLVGCAPRRMEFYEENLCWLFPCYEVDYLLRRK